MAATVFSLITSVISALICGALFVAILANRRGLTVINQFLALALWGTATGVLGWFAWGYWRILTGTLDSRDAGETLFRQVVPALFALIGIHAAYTYTLLLQQEDLRAVERRVNQLERRLKEFDDIIS